MKRLALLLVAATLPALAAQTGYRVDHPDGTVEFTDQAPPDDSGKPVPLPEVQTLPPTPTRPSTTPRRSPGPPAGVDYQQLTVTQPRPGETIWVSQWRIPVAVSLTPDLAPGHEIVIRVDGEPVARGTGASYLAEPIYRGEHQVRAQVVNEAGKVLISSPAVTFYVHKHQVNRP